MNEGYAGFDTGIAALQNCVAFVLLLCRRACGQGWVGMTNSCLSAAGTFDSCLMQT